MGTDDPLAGAVAIMIALWMRPKIPRKVDLAWLAAGRGVAGNAHPAADFADAGEKWLEDAERNGTLVKHEAEDDQAQAPAQGAATTS